MSEYDHEARHAPPGEVTMKEARTSHVASAMDAADEEASLLIDAIRELESRLCDVLRPHLDSADKLTGVPHETLVPLAERLTSHNGTVRMARQYVVSILDRLEL